jgi:RNA ligase (TIGR02306 family)
MGEVEGFRLKTIRLRKKLSQGLLLPISQFPEVCGKPEGEDVTSVLGVVKWEPPVPVCLAGDAKGPFPSFIQKTDEERIQNLPEYFELYKDVVFEESIKLDGTSATFYFRDGEFGVCSRNLELKESDANLYWKIAKQLSLKERLAVLGRNIALQGEIIGEGIQGNNEKIKGQKFFLFNIYDIDKSRLLDFNERDAVLYSLNVSLPQIDTVPVTYRGPIFHCFSTMDALLDLANGPSLNQASRREGLVYKSVLMEHGIVSFKVISNEYLLSE